MGYETSKGKNKTEDRTKEAKKTNSLFEKGSPNLPKLNGEEIQAKRKKIRAEPYVIDPFCQRILELDRSKGGTKSGWQMGSHSLS